MVAVANIFLLFVMTLFDNSVDTQVAGISDNSALSEAIRAGDIGRAEGIIRRLLAEELSQEINQQVGRSVVTPASFWNFLIKPEWIDISQALTNLSGPLIALNIANQILASSNINEQGDRAQQLTRATRDDFHYGQKAIPSWSWLSRSRDMPSKRKASKQLEIERNELASELSHNFRSSVDDLKQRLRSAR